MNSFYIDLVVEELANDNILSDIEILEFVKDINVLAKKIDHSNLLNEGMKRNAKIEQSIIQSLRNISNYKKINPKKLSQDSKIEIIQKLLLDLGKLLAIATAKNNNSKRIHQKVLSLV